jgi:two-component system, cell cycle response regulator
MNDDSVQRRDSATTLPRLVVSPPVGVRRSNESPDDGVATEPPPSNPSPSSGPISAAPSTLSVLDDDAAAPLTDAPPPMSFSTSVGVRRATLTLMTGANAGETFALASECEIGRAPEATLFVHDAGVSRHHARIFRRLDGRYFVEDLNSSNGTFVGPRSVTCCELTPGDRIRLGPSTVFRFTISDDAELALQRKLYDASTRDALTRVYNRRYLQDRLVTEMREARRKQTPLAVLLVDLDFFKQTNDKHGHLAGDQVLRTVSAHVALYLRSDDFVARYGGEEFVIVARAPRTSAAILAERMRSAIEKLPIPMEDGPVYVTASFGVAEISEIDPASDGDALIGLADSRLYRAKHFGRNCVCASDDASV